jgi:hypothetical protein
VTSIARLKDVFLDRSPRRVLGCTYGFQPEFFEQEILPSMLPELTLDRGAGNLGSYLNAGDEALGRCPVLILCDHAEAGRELPYNLEVTKPGRFAFHPKLLLLDYTDVIRVAISSANLTRSGWSSALELFIYEDIEPGGRHGWGAPLVRFLEGTSGLISQTARDELEPYITLMRRVKKPIGPFGWGPELVSSFDGPLMDAALDAMGNVSSVDVVTPFLEGEEGAGVFDRLESQHPAIRGTLYLRAEDADGTPVVRGPEEKLRRLLGSGRWQVQRVRAEWEGDEEDAPPSRELHGKLLALRKGKRAKVLIGSANVTAAALLRFPPNGNVELCCLLDLSTKQLKAILPQSDGLPTGEFRIDAADAEPESVPTAADWVVEAIYRGDRAELELALEKGAPPLEVTYQGKTLTTSASPPVWRSKLRLGKELEVTLRDGRKAGAEPAVIPFLVLDIGLVSPRGLSRDPTIDELLDIMAGAREPVDSGETNGNGPGPNGPGGTNGLLHGGSAFAWRKLMRALAGLERDLRASAGFEPEVRRLLDGPLGAKGLLEALDRLRTGETFLDADFAFALHQLRLVLARVNAGFESKPKPEGETTGREHLARWSKDLAAQFADIRSNADATLNRQLKQLEAECKAK